MKTIQETITSLHFLARETSANMDVSLGVNDAAVDYLVQLPNADVFTNLYADEGQEPFAIEGVVVHAGESMWRGLTIRAQRNTRPLTAEETESLVNASPRTPGRWMTSRKTGAAV